MTYTTDCLSYGGFFEYDAKVEDIQACQAKLLDPEVWSDTTQSQSLQKKISANQKVVENLDELTRTSQEITELCELCLLETDDDSLQSAYHELQDLERALQKQETARLFSQPHDRSNAFLDVQSGSGGTEAQDWAEMLARMYTRWAEKKGFSVDLMDWSEGDVAGIKSATLKISGDYAFGWLRTETGIHRLVRKSPFDSGNRRHTSFAAVFISPEIDDNIEVDINPADLRIDTYRSSGAGGQHVNTTDSAVRITHSPSKIVVQCQSERSQHQNKAKAMLQLRAKLYEYLRLEKLADQQASEQNKDAITWGRQIRSYVLDQSRVKDIRTDVESSNPQAVLDGELDQFIEASLKQGI